MMSSSSDVGVAVLSSPAPPPSSRSHQTSPTRRVGLVVLALVVLGVLEQSFLLYKTVLIPASRSTLAEVQTQAELAQVAAAPAKHRKSFFKTTRTKEEDLLSTAYQPLTRPYGGGTIQKHAGTNTSPPNDDNNKFLLYSGNGDCVCDVLSVDCLDSVRCLPKTQREALHQVAIGIQTRRAIKETATFTSHDISARWMPIGKGCQYSTRAAWKSWKDRNQLPIGLSHTSPSLFVNETWYPYCVERQLVGKACFLNDLSASEDLYDLERSALHNIVNLSDIPSSESYQQVKADVIRFQQRQQRPKQDDPLSALSYLLSFAHIARIRFNLQRHMREIYQKRVESVVHVPPSRNNNNDNNTIRVSLHLRRADACNHAQQGYESNPSPLDSPAQVSGKRMCYATFVYLNALKRVQELSPGKTVEVYLATDHAGSVMDEIRNNFTDLYKQMNWYYLNYFQDDIFNYEGAIEFEAVGKDKQAMLGESAVADLFHMSHGEVFIGHLGSRFGKVSWLLATARYNRFIPFMTVDGHSFCCEIDEACGQVKPYIVDMENCLTFAHELMHTIKANDDYWVTGSRKREAYVKQQQEKSTT